MIWETILDFSKSLDGEDLIIFLSNNKNDFGQGDNQLHPDLKAECKASEGKDIIYISTIHDYINHVLQNDLDRLESIKDALNESQKYGNIDFRDALDDIIHESTNDKRDQQEQPSCVSESNKYGEITDVGEPKFIFTNVCKLDEEVTLVTCRIEEEYTAISYVPLKVNETDEEAHLIKFPHRSTSYLVVSMLVDKDFQEVIDIEVAFKGCRSSLGMSVMQRPDHDPKYPVDYYDVHGGPKSII